MESIFLEPGEGERITGDDELGVTLFADIEQIGIVEVRSEPGGVTPPLHLHTRHAECFFVLEGELTFRLEDRELRADRPGERGAKPHIHRHHADGFLVLEGELTVAFRSGQLRASAGTLVVIPPQVVHSFDNDGAENALFYNPHMPSSGFGDYLRGRNPDFDQHDPPADGGADPASVVAVRLSG